jgi:phage shock protein PspC (stress-responsive transcriptional regulator)
LGGVIAGLGRHYGIELWRAPLLFVLFLMLIHGSQLLIYPILWIVVPIEGNDLPDEAVVKTVDLANAMRRAERAHGEHEKRTRQRNVNWPDWNAAHMAAEQSGGQLPT